MPNWCLNTITITGPHDELERFASRFTEDEDGDISLLDTFHPFPDGIDDWYGWCVDNWGTKWPDKSRRVAKDQTDRLVFIGDTAWSPPIRGLATIAEDWPALTFSITYDEPGMCFYGAAVFRGSVLSQTESLYPEHEPVDYEDTEAYQRFESLIETLCEQALEYVTKQLETLKA